MMDGLSGVQPAEQTGDSAICVGASGRRDGHGESSRQERWRYSSVARTARIYRAVRSAAAPLEGPRLNPCSQWRATIPPVAWAQRTSAMATGRVSAGIAAGTVSMLFSSSDGAGLSGCAIGGGAPRRSSAKSVLSMARNDSACCVGAADVGVATGRARRELRQERCRCSSVARTARVLSGCAIGGGAPRRSSAKSVLSVARNDSAICVGAAGGGMATGRVAAGTVSMLFSCSGGAGISGCAIGGGAPRRSSAKSMLSVARNDSACCVGAADVGVATGRVAAGMVSMLFSGSERRGYIGLCDRWRRPSKVLG